MGDAFLSAGHSNGERSQTKKAGLRMGNTAHTTVHETSVQFVFGVHVQSACLQCPQTTQSQILPGVCTGRSSVDPCVQADKATMYWPLETTRVLKALGDYISGALISIGLMHVGCVIDAFSTNTDFHCDQRSLPHDMKTCIVKLCF